MSRQEYYESSVKEIKSLIDIHLKFNNINLKNDVEERVYSIDEIPWL